MENIILITDPNEDTDDLVSLICTSALVKTGKINLLGVVATVGDLKTRTLRAQYAKGIYKYLKQDIPVCVGGEYNRDIPNRKLQDNIFVDSTYLDRIIKKGQVVEHDCDKFVSNILSNAQDHSVTVVNIAGFTDLANMINKDSQLFCDKIKQVCIMANFLVPKQGDRYEPDFMAHNNQIDAKATEYVFDKLQELDITTYVVNSKNTKKVPISMKYYEDMRFSDNIISKHAYEIQKEGLKRHYDNILLGKAEDKYTVEWFYKNYTCIKDNTPRDFDEVWKNLNRLYLYDPLTVLVAIEDYRHDYFDIVNYDNFKLCVPKNHEAIYNLFNELPKIAMNY